MRASESGTGMSDTGAVPPMQGRFPKPVGRDTVDLAELDAHRPSEIGNMFGGYDCTCGDPWTTFHETWAIRNGLYNPVAKPPPDTDWLRMEKIGGHPLWFNVVAGVLLAALVVLVVADVLLLWGWRP